ncbi:hypothetical protein XENTR_v10009449 [Xenopus tropicalis]|nr:hypothetical protein XENTR_v10009449 [Xenopus tropicalis]
MGLYAPTLGNNRFKPFATREVCNALQKPCNTVPSESTTVNQPQDKSAAALIGCIKYSLCLVLSIKILNVKY